jgi:ribosome-binding factor A
MQGKRLERVNQLMREEISMLLQREIKDPRLGFVTVTEVAVTNDLKQAKVYVSVLGNDAQWVKSFKALESARGFVWRWLRQNLDLRVTPEISFRPDRSMEHAARMQSLLAGLHAESRDREKDDG